MSFAPNPYYEAVYEACAKLVGEFGIVAVSNEWAPNTDISAVIVWTTTPEVASKKLKHVEKGVPIIVRGRGPRW